ARDIDRTRLLSGAGLHDRDLAAPRADDDGLLGRRLSDDDVVDEDVRALDVRFHDHLRHAALELLDLAFDLLASILRDVLAAVDEILLERAERLRVVLELEVRLTEVVEDFVVR